MKTVDELKEEFRASAIRADEAWHAYRAASEQERESWKALDEALTENRVMDAFAAEKEIMDAKEDGK